MSKQKNPLRLNIGFIIHETPGYTRVFEFNFPHLELSPELPVKDFKGTATFSRTQRGILLEGEFAATLPTECVRCLNNILTPITSAFTELYAFDISTETENELIVPEDGYLDLAPIAHDYLSLDVSHNPVCKADCAGLCPVCGINLNKEKCDCETDSVDPRMSKLKDLLDKDE